MKEIDAGIGRQGPLSRQRSPPCILKWICVWAHMQFYGGAVAQTCRYMEKLLASSLALSFNTAAEVAGIVTVHRPSSETLTGVHSPLHAALFVIMEPPNVTPLVASTWPLEDLRNMTAAVPRMKVFRLNRHESAFCSMAIFLVNQGHEKIGRAPDGISRQIQPILVLHRNGFRFTMTANVECLDAISLRVDLIIARGIVVEGIGRQRMTILEIDTGGPVRRPTNENNPMPTSRRKMCRWHS